MRLCSVKHLVQENISIDNGGDGGVLINHFSLNGGPNRYQPKTIADPRLSGFEDRY